MCSTSESIYFLESEIDAERVAVVVDGRHHVGDVAKYLAGRQRKSSRNASIVGHDTDCNLGVSIQVVVSDSAAVVNGTKVHHLTKSIHFRTESPCFLWTGHIECVSSDFGIPYVKDAVRLNHGFLRFWLERVNLLLNVLDDLLLLLLEAFQ